MGPCRQLSVQDEFGRLQVVVRTPGGLGVPVIGVVRSTAVSIAMHADVVGAGMDDPL